ncbi:CHASE2 domain-containing protein [Vibrio sp. F74]|uniref:CHASE2 domain-containing protein n=1 Tax=Vibrio sp. F74 TaxID=700020 RepID=UPI0035F5CB1D
MKINQQWKVALNLFYHKYNFMIQWSMLFLLGAWIIFSDPFGIGSASERAGEQAIYKLTAHSYDSAKSQPNILVVLFNDKAIENLYPEIWQSNDWPLSYLDQVNMLTAIMTQSPMAVFYDVMWMKKRALDDSFDRAIAKLNAARSATNVPLYFAQGKADSVMEKEVREALSPSVSLVPNGWEERAELYPLYTDEVATTANVLYQEYCKNRECESPLRDEKYPISVRWSEIAAPVLLSHRKDECILLDTSWYGAVWSSVNKVINSIIPMTDDQQVQKICPPQRVLYIDELMALARSPIDEERQQLKRWIQDSIVLVGGQIEGIHDYVISPVHGAMPGVFFHAMALDNLMVDQNEYIRDDPNAEYINMIVWTLYVTLLVAVRRFAYKYKVLMCIKSKLLLSSLFYVCVVLFFAYGVFHLAPASWVSILALGWLGIQLIERLERRMGEWRDETKYGD